MKRRHLWLALALGPLTAAAQEPLSDSRELIRKAYSYTEDDKYKEAITTLQKVNRSDTNYMQALNLLVRCYYQDSNFQRSYDLCIEGQKQFPEERQFWLTNQANNLDMMKQPDKALGMYDSLLRLAPYHYEAYYNKAVTYNKMDRQAEAIKSLEECLRIR